MPAPPPKRLPRHLRKTRLELGHAFEAQRLTNPKLYAELLALIAATTKRAQQWRTNEIRLPLGVQVVPMLDDHGRKVYTIDWGREPPPAPSTYLLDECLAVEAAWTVFMLRRPWAIDDDRLRALVEHPPAPHARILGELLSIRMATWVREAFGVLAVALIETPPPDQPIEAIHELVLAFGPLVQGYDARAGLSIYELSALLDVTEPDAGLGYESYRWFCMLSDYTRALDPPLHERLSSLADRFGSTKRKPVREAWKILFDCRQLDACLGVLLTRVTMLDPNARPSLVQGYVDPMATRAAGSFAWWCRSALESWEDDYEVGDRLRLDEIPTFVGLALRKLHELDAGLAEALLRVFPIEA